MTTDLGGQAGAQQRAVHRPARFHTPASLRRAGLTLGYGIQGTMTAFAPMATAVACQTMNSDTPSRVPLA